MAEGTVRPWDQREGESDRAYAAFLTYLTLGIRRTVEGAYNSHSLLPGDEPPLPAGKKRQASGQWNEWQTRFDWRERAIAYDIHHLTERSQRIPILITEMIAEAATKALAALVRPEVAPANWSEAMDALKTLTQLISPDALEKLQKRTPPAGNG